MELDHVLSSRDTINAKLREILDEATHKWGAKVSRVELKDINPPRDIRDAMEKQMRAERDRRAAILTAEAEKQSRTLQSEGIGRRPRRPKIHLTYLRRRRACWRLWAASVKGGRAREKKETGGEEVEEKGGRCAGGVVLTPLPVSPSPRL